VTKVFLHTTEEGFIRGFTVSGHSGYAESGQDIICSAVSALSQTVISALKEMTDLEVRYRIEEEKAYIECEIVQEVFDDQNQYLIAFTIMRVFEIGCRKISESYGKQYLRVIESPEDRLRRVTT
jgi:uncharacterized protein